MHEPRLYASARRRKKKTQSARRSHLECAYIVRAKARERERERVSKRALVCVAVELSAFMRAQGRLSPADSRAPDVTYTRDIENILIASERLDRIYELHSHTQLMERSKKKKCQIFSA